MLVVCFFSDRREDEGAVCLVCGVRAGGMLRLEVLKSQLWNQKGFWAFWGGRVSPPMVEVPLTSSSRLNRTDSGVMHADSREFS